jgi:hypothetical protein
VRVNERIPRLSSNWMQEDRMVVSLKQTWGKREMTRMYLVRRRRSSSPAPAIKSDAGRLGDKAEGEVDEVEPLREVRTPLPTAAILLHGFSMRPSALRSSICLMRGYHCPVMTKTMTGSSNLRGSPESHRRQSAVKMINLSRDAWT